MIGKTISHYKILEKLGGGGMGAVYKAEDTKLKRIVALKFLPPEWSRDQGSKERFAHEAQAASALQHNNICTIHEIDETSDGQMFICMDFYEGATLKKKIDNGPLPLEKAIDTATQIAQGLGCAHEAGIVHRDIKPANVMITNRDEVKILDFGLAKLAGRTKLTKEDTTLGTVAYMSPEQAQGVEVDHRGDIWALGAVLYEMVTGRQPFAGDYEQAVVYSIMNEEPEPVTGLRTGVPLELERIASKALAKKPDERYQHVDEMIVDLKAVHKAFKSQGAKTQKTRLGTGLKKMPILVSSLAAIALLATIVFFIFKSTQTASENKKSIAVLPFENLNEEADKYFTDGITEDILTQLSKIADLRVLARFTIRQYEVGDKSPSEIGKDLNVANLLVGSIRRAGDQLRIGCQLIDTKTQEQIWAETYDRKLQDVFAIQSEVAHQIARTLKAKLSPVEKARIATRPTADLTAYDYYLKGRESYYRYRKDDNEHAITMFMRALQLDPDYVLAWAGLGDAYAQKYLRFGYAYSWADSAIAVSQKALALDSNSADCYKALGLAYQVKGLYHKALEAHLKALDRNPNYFVAVANVGVIYLKTGELDEALPWLKKTAALNPKFGALYAFFGQVYRLLSDANMAEQWLKKTLELQPDYSDGHYQTSLLYLTQRKDQQAIDQIKKLLSYEPENAEILKWAGRIAGYVGNFSQAKQYYQASIATNASRERTPFTANGVLGLGHILWKDEQRDEAQKLFNLSLELSQKRIEQGNEDYFFYYDIAAIHAIQGNKEEAYIWLQKAIDFGWREYKLAQRDPWFENLHSEPRFQQMIAEIKAMIDEMRQRVEEMEREEASRLTTK